MAEINQYQRNQGRAMSSSHSSPKPTKTTKIHVTALDGIVSVNSFYTFAVFMGLSLAVPGQHSLHDRTACHAEVNIAKKLIVFEVFSFSFYLFSSLVAQGLKLAINLLNSRADSASKADVNLRLLKFGIMGSVVGSVLGCVFLLLSMVNIIEIRLGILSCRSKHTVSAVTALAVLVSSGLLVYISTYIYAVVKKLETKNVT